MSNEKRKRSISERLNSARAPELRAQISYEWVGETESYFTKLIDRFFHDKKISAEVRTTLLEVIGKKMNGMESVIYRLSGIKPND